MPEPAALGRRALMLIAAGLVLRLLLVAFWAPRIGLGGDPGDYLTWGRALAETRQYRQTPHQDKMPGMAALVAVGCQLGERGCLGLPYALITLLGVAAAVGLWWLLRRFLRPAARLPALAVLLFTVPELSMLSFRLLPDLPALALGIGAVLALGSALESSTVGRRGGWVAVAGLVLGLALYLRPDYSIVALTLGGTFALLAWRRFGFVQAAALGSLTVGLAAAAVVPWGLRNQGITGHFQVTSHQGARTLWWAFNDHRNLDWTRTGDEPWIGHPRPAWGTIARQEALTWIRAHPLAAAELVAWRVASHFGPAPVPVISAAATQVSPRWLRRGFRLLLVAVHETWLLLGLAALVAGGRRLPPPLLLLGAFTASRLVLPGALTPDGGRYALVLVPFLAACTLWRLGDASVSGPGATRALWLAPDFRRALLWTAPVLLVVQAALVVRWGWV